MHELELGQTRPSVCIINKNKNVSYSQIHTVNGSPHHTSCLAMDNKTINDSVISNERNQLGQCVPYEAIKINFMCLHLEADGLSIPAATALALTILKVNLAINSPIRQLKQTNMAVGRTVERAK